MAWHNFLLCSQNPMTRLSFRAGREMLWKPWNWSKKWSEGEVVNYPHGINDIPVLCCACCRKQSGNSSNVKFTWKVVYNGSCGSICTWKAKNIEGTFQFRAAAANVLGLGKYSDISMDIILSEGMSCTSLNLFLIILYSHTNLWTETGYFNNNIPAKVE